MRTKYFLVGLASCFLACNDVARAIDLDLGSAESIKQAASTVAFDMMKYYTGNKTGDTPGNLPAPYYWWEAGAMFGAMIDYWHYTGDTTYNDVVYQALLWQTGPNRDFMTPNQTKTTGNDDQAFWGLAAMSAAEKKFPDPPRSEPQWLALAQAVFNTQARRWDESTCGGGLRWQVFPFNNGYNYKNTVSNGCFFNLAARLARYTGNDTYAQWAEKTWNWMESITLFSDDYQQVYDGSDILKGCREVDRARWTYNAGTLLMGAANMYSYNGGEIWRKRVQGLVDGLEVFFPNGDNIMQEVMCEPWLKCDVDQRSFKAYLSRWMAATAKLAPFTRDAIMTKLRASAAGAAKQCVGGETGRACGMKWVDGHIWDGTSGVGEQMAALEVIQSNLIDLADHSVTESTGGTSEGNGVAGGGRKSTQQYTVSAATIGDKFGAGFVTAVVVCVFMAMFCWMAWERDMVETPDKDTPGTGNFKAIKEVSL